MLHERRISDVERTAKQAHSRLQLNEPSFYIPDLHKLRNRNKYTKSWKLKLETKTNRHPETAGGTWGWYEIFPLGITVGYWGSTKDDLKKVDIQAWNAEAERLSS